MSLFGSAGNQNQQNQQSDAQSKSTLFSRTTGGAFSLANPPNSSSSSTSQPGATSSIFGNAGANQQNQQQSTTGSSLFGNLSSSQPQQQQTQTTSNVFGGATSNQQSSGGGLFGGLASAASQPQAQSGSLPTLNLGSSQSQQGKPNLFGSLGTQQQQPASTSGGLFGAGLSGAQQSQPPAGASLFGSSLLTQPTGGQTQQQQQQQPTGQNAQQSQGPARSTAHFHDLLERGKKRQNLSEGSSTFGDLPQLQLGLGDIAGKLRALDGSKGGAAVRRQNDTRSEYLLAASGVPLGSTRRDLNEFSTQAGGTGTQAPPPPLDTDIEAYVANMQAKSTQDLINESLEQAKRDFDAFLEDHIQINLDEQRQRVYEHFGLAKPSEDPRTSVNGQASQTARGAFGKSSRRGRNTIGANGSASMSFGASGMSRSVLGGSVANNKSQQNLFTDVADKAPSTGLQSATEDPFIRSKQEKYAAKVRELNASRLQEVIYPVVEQFGQVESDAGSDVPKHLIDGFRALQHITRENSNVQRPSDPGAVKERQYAKDYLDERPGSGRSLVIRKQILDGSRAFLEHSYFQGVEDLIAKNPREANLGGVPSKVNKLRAYIRIKAARKDLGTDPANLQKLGEDYCWALIFVLLRSGLVKEASQYVADNLRAIKSMDRNFPQYIEAYVKDPDRKLPRDMQVKINSEYQQRLRIAADNSIDPYRMACYKVIGRCDLGKKQLESIAVGMEDWMWVIFSLAREVNRVEEAATEVFGLEEIRAMVEDIGQRHFISGDDSATGYATYFWLQALSGMFEQAVAWLYSRNYVSAVHFAIACDFYGLLRVSDFAVSESELLTYTTRQKPQISFARLLGYYTRDFRIARAEAATDYLTLICLNADLEGEAGQAQAAVCHEALKELVLETREFALLLGDISGDGKRVKGAIEQRLKLINLKDQDDFLQNLTVQAAAVADDAGRTTDAVLLYHLAEDYDSVVTIINRAVSDALAVDIGQEPLRLQPLKPRATEADIQQQANNAQANKDANRTDTLSLTSVDDPAALARNMIALYNSDASYFRKIRPANRDACGILLRMSDVKARTAASKWAEALDLIDSLELLPLHARGNVSAIRSYAQSFSALQSVVARNIGHLLMWTITCCGRQRDVLKSSAFQSNVPMAEGLLQAARDLMVFAGLVRYKLPGEVFEVLARAGQEVGV